MKVKVLITSEVIQKSLYHSKRNKDFNKVFGRYTPTTIALKDLFPIAEISTNLLWPFGQDNIETIAIPFELDSFEGRFIHASSLLNKYFNFPELEFIFEISNDIVQKLGGKQQVEEIVSTSATIQII